jgi:hypothetical protein
MKRAFFSIILFILLCFLGNHTIDYTMGRQIENRSPYSLAFASIGAFSLESRQDCWAKLRTSSTEDEMKRYMRHMLSSLNLEYQPDKVLIHTSNQGLEMEYSTTDNSIDYYLAVQSNTEHEQTHFIVCAETIEQDKFIPPVKEQLGNMGILEWHDYYLYKGELKNTFDQSGTSRLAGVIMKNLDAVTIENYYEGMTFSCTGYSKSLAKSIRPVWSEGQRYNVQVAFYSSPSQDKTYVYIGFPLIVGNY